MNATKFVARIVVFNLQKELNQNKFKPIIVNEQYIYLHKILKQYIIMSLKNVITTFVLSACIAISTISCKSKVSDTDLKAKVENVVSSSPGIVVEVKDGVVTLSGTVVSDADREALANSAKEADSKNIKSVVNNIVVQAPTVEVNADDVDLAAKVVDATKDFPTVQTTVKDGVITVTGTLEQSRIQVLKQSLDALSPKRVDLSAIVIK